jgi:hypothetical protein
MQVQLQRSSITKSKKLSFMGIHSIFPVAFGSAVVAGTSESLLGGQVKVANWHPYFCSDSRKR